MNPCDDGADALAAIIYVDISTLLKIVYMRLAFLVRSDAGRINVG
jgi:hypothetical protein